MALSIREQVAKPPAWDLLATLGAPGRHLAFFPKVGPMAIAALPAERLDAVVVGASVEGLFAAACLGAAGKHVALLDAADSPEDIEGPSPDDGVVDLDSAQALDLAAHGLRFGAPAPVVAVSSDQDIVIWPDAEATVGALGALSGRDADAFVGFRWALARALRETRRDDGAGLLGRVLSPSNRDALATEAGALRATSVARLLDETFTLPLLKGALAQCALTGSSVSPRLPGSAALFLRPSFRALLGLDPAVRAVAGGAGALCGALLASLKFCNTADVHFGVSVRDLVRERDAVVGVTLADGTVLRAANVIAALPGASRLPGLSRMTGETTRAGRLARNGRIVFTVSMPPAIRGVGASLVTSGACIQLNPSLAGLVRGAAAARGRLLVQDYGLELRVRPTFAAQDAARWTVIADILHVPAETEEGPWSGNRRERLVSLIANAIETWAPGFELSVTSARLVAPAPVLSLLEADHAGVRVGSEVADVPGLADMQHEGFQRAGRGLWLLGDNHAAGAGRGGVGLARLLGAAANPRAGADV